MKQGNITEYIGYDIYADHICYDCRWLECYDVPADGKIVRLWKCKLHSVPDGCTKKDIRSRGVYFDNA